MLSASCTVIALKKLHLCFLYLLNVLYSSLCCLNMVLLGLMQNYQFFALYNFKSSNKTFTWEKGPSPPYLHYGNLELITLMLQLKDTAALGSIHITKGIYTIKADHLLWSSRIEQAQPCLVPTCCYWVERTCAGLPYPEDLPFKQTKVIAWAAWWLSG